MFPYPFHRKKLKQDSKYKDIFMIIERQRDNLSWGGRDLNTKDSDENLWYKFF